MTIYYVESINTKKWWSSQSGRPIDKNGEPLPSININAGAVQGTDPSRHPFHPKNL